MRNSHTTHCELFPIVPAPLSSSVWKQLTWVRSCSVRRFLSKARDFAPQTFRGLSRYQSPEASYNTVLLLFQGTADYRSPRQILSYSSIRRTLQTNEMG